MMGSDNSMSAGSKKVTGYQLPVSGEYKINRPSAIKAWQPGPENRQPLVPGNWQPVTGVRQLLFYILKNYIILGANHYIYEIHYVNPGYPGVFYCAGL
jgi:hypothetical protein